MSDTTRVKQHDTLQSKVYVQPC